MLAFWRIIDILAYPFNNTYIMIGMGVVLVGLIIVFFILRNRRDED